MLGLSVPLWAYLLPALVPLGLVGVGLFIGTANTGILLGLAALAAPGFCRRVVDANTFAAMRGRFFVTREHMFTYFQQHPEWAVAYLRRADTILAEELVLIAAQIERSRRTLKEPINAPERSRHERVLAGLVTIQNRHLRLRAGCAATIAEAELALVRKEPVDGLAAFLRDTQAYIEATCEVDRAAAMAPAALARKGQEGRNA